ncbi:NAD(P)/FAD-dependent oxidoreductase [Mesonia aquimarina]|uniref:NAD(P)/FAD-dependent oxidoreductase n=1 Tax=Mesonia aquimarina TaxID=1504967 RepID=UPI000EF579E2|nr:NAD(P)/FAD-dependent oxidoreductase [Mesonia aquimarina]
MIKEHVDVLIIGAGPSGTVAASYLKKHGFSVKIIEKENFPRYTVGESLIPRCMDNFEEAGLLTCLKKQNYQVKIGARFIRNGVEGNFDFSEKFGEGWDWTWQVPRDHFDNVLAEECQKNGVSIEFATKVENIEFSASEKVVVTTLKNNIKEKYQGRFIIDASGPGRVLAKQLNLEAAPKTAIHSSIFTQVKDSNRPTGKEGELITFDIIENEVWFWYIPFSNGNTSIGFVGKKEWFQKFSPNTSEAFTQMLPDTKKYYPQFKDLDFNFEPIKVNNIAKNVTKFYGDDFVLTGNSAEFLDPVFSSGVSFATESGLLAAKLCAKQLNGEKVDWQKGYVDYMQEGVEVFSTYVKEWYTGNLQEIILHQKPTPEIKQQICAVLAGYVWNKNNPFVRNHKKMIPLLAKLIKSEKSTFAN